MTTTPSPITRIALVLDDSGSMSHLRAKALETFNGFLTSIRDESAKHDQDTAISVYTFGSTVAQVTHNVPAANARPLSPAQYLANGGSTRLYDAVGQAIEDFQRMPDANAEHVSFVVMAITDGEENASIRWNAHKLRKAIETTQTTGRYTITFQVPKGGYARSLSAALTLPAGNIHEWETSERGLRETRVATEQAIGQFYTSRAAGQRASGQFFTNLQALTPGELRARCADVSATCQILTVERAADIRTFCEQQTGQPYIRGAAFYQLTKPETVQASKDVAIVEAGRSAVYAGGDARKLLGLPDWQDVKVKPGDHAGWEVFVQSTSTNRRLEAGTRLIYMMRA